MQTRSLWNNAFAPSVPSSHFQDILSQRGPLLIWCYSFAKPTSERGSVRLEIDVDFNEQKHLLKQIKLIFLSWYSNRHQRQSRQSTLEPVMIIERTADDGNPAHRRDRAGRAPL